MHQLTNHIMMIRPANFGFNDQTAANNAFQSKDEIFDAQFLKNVAREEFDNMVDILRSKGVSVFVIEDTEMPIKPDAVFPNNWISFHENGTLITYPMYAPNRRIERREDIIEQIENRFVVKNRYSFEFYETEDELFLEGTGSMIFDRPNGIVYACLSQRTDATLLDKFNVLMGMESCVFRSVDRFGLEIYHTNVMMALGEDFVVICMESIPDEDSRKKLLSLFEKTGKEVIEISYAQMESFAGNMLEVMGSGGNRYLVLSQSAYDALTSDQVLRLSALTNLLPIPIPNIEKFGGGSVRCMMAEVFLPVRR
ncbi:MAG: amidinotransferase [Saprospiraceae bacterium]|nr:amidinotransferase [Saprospiraceae bacterium]